MIVAGHPDQPNAIQRTGKLPDGTSVVATFMLSDAEGPDAFLVHQPPGSVLPAHFHFNRQFQLFLRGEGVLGRHAITPLTLHYSAAETGYGPIRAGEKGLSYLTLRQVGERGAQYLPESAGLLRQGVRRRQITRHVPLSTIAELSCLDYSRVDVLVPEDQTGLLCWAVQLPPNGEATEPNASGGDRYWFVAAGSIQSGGVAQPGRSVIWLTRDEPARTLSAGPQGAQLLVLRFPTSD